jgi:ParB-like chromosome segregation protein Spo0J
VLKEKKRASRRPNRSARTSPPSVKRSKKKSQNPGHAGPDGATPTARMATPGELGETPAGIRLLVSGPLIDGGGKTWRIHPLAAIMPLMSDGEYALLKKSIAQAGRNRAPILTGRDGRVLDGRHRLAACIELGIEPHAEAWDGAGSELDLILDLNNRRRQLSGSQRVLIAAKLARLGQGRPRENAPIRAITQDEAADMLGVSRTQVQAARTVLASGVPELIGLVERGDLVVSVARQIAALRRDEQKRLVIEGPKALRARAAAIRSEAESNRSRRKGATDRTLAEECEQPVAIDPHSPAESLDGRPEEDVGGSEAGSAGTTAQVEQADEPIEAADGEPDVLTADLIAEVSSSSTSPAGSPEPANPDRCGGEVARGAEPIEAGGNELSNEADSRFERQSLSCNAEPTVAAVASSVPVPAGTLDVTDRCDGNSDAGPEQAGLDRRVLQPGPRAQDDRGVEGELRLEDGTSHPEVEPAASSYSSGELPIEDIPLRARLANPSMFDIDARIYRDVRANVETLQGRLEQDPQIARNLGQVPWSARSYARQLEQLVRIPPPGEWIVCWKCEGKGKTNAAPICGTCGGACYQCQ